MKYGQEKGDICNRDGCIGKMYFFPEDTSPRDDSVFCDACYSVFNARDVMTNESLLKELWIVYAPDGPDFAASERGAAEEYAADMVGHFPGLGPWTVHKYVLERN